MHFESYNDISNSIQITSESNVTKPNFCIHWTNDLNFKLGPVTISIKLPSSN